MTLTIRRSDAWRFVAMDSCPLKAWYAMENPTPPTEAMMFGQVVHYLALEGDNPPWLYVLPTDSLRDKESKAVKEEAEKADAPWMRPGDFDKARAMAAELKHNREFKQLMSVGGQPEQQLQFTDEKTGIIGTCRLDFLPKTGPVYWDYKTTKSAAPSDFERDAAKYGYHFQAAWYLEAIQQNGLCDAPHFLFVAQEKDPPFTVQIHALDVFALDQGRAEMREALKRIADNDRSGYVNGINQAGLPIWYMKRREDDDVGA